MATNPSSTASPTKTVVTQQPSTYQEMLNYMLPTKLVNGQVFVPRITTNNQSDPKQLNDFDHWHGASGKSPHTHVGNDLGYSQLNTTTGNVDYLRTREPVNQNVSLGAPVGGVLTIVEGSSTNEVRITTPAGVVLLLLISLSLTSAFAGDGRSLKHNKPTPKSLIGEKIEGGKYPDGWVPDLWAIHAKDHNFVVLRKEKSYAFVLEKPAGVGMLKTSTIVDVVSLKGRPQRNGWHDMSTDCRGPSIPIDPRADHVQIRFIAEVVYKKCARYSSNILSAWWVDLQKNTISSLPTTGMRCGNTYLDSGEIPECKFIPKEW
ncbi:MAG: hypothetical protein V4858_25095 [Pseudomonadota bacterium]